MSIQTYRLALDGIPGAERMVMRTARLEDGGEADEFSIDDKAVQVRPGATPDEVKQAFMDALKE